MGYYQRHPVTGQMTDIPFKYTEAGIRQAIENHVPWEWQEWVCICYVPQDGQTSTTCAHCDKLRRWLFRKCEDCKQGFIFLHKHHAMYKGQPDYDYNNYKFCYPCLVKKFGEVEGDVPPDPKYRPRALMDVAEFRNLDFGDIEDFTF